MPERQKTGRERENGHPALDARGECTLVSDADDPGRGSGRSLHNAVVAADLSGVPFADYLVADNLYTGYLQTQRADLLRQAAALLYQAPDITLNAEEELSVFYWLASLKAHYQRRFRHPSAPATDSGNLLTDTQDTAQRLQAAMDNQIRALTKGDITKEEQVLATDAIRALTELDAMAREYQDLQKEMHR